MKWTLVELCGLVLAVAALPCFVVAGWSVSWQLGVCLLGVSLLLVGGGAVIVANLQPSGES